MLALKDPIRLGNSSGRKRSEQKHTFRNSLTVLTGAGMPRDDHLAVSSPSIVNYLKYIVKRIYDHIEEFEAFNLF